MSSQTGAGPGIAAVRERERLRAGLGSVAQCRIVIGQYGGLSALTRTLSRELRLRGATVMSLDEPDAVAQATAANHFAADVYLGFETHTDPAATIQFYRVPAFESAGGHALAEIIAENGRIGELEPDVRGMRLPMLPRPECRQCNVSSARSGGYRCWSSDCRRHHRRPGTMGLTVYLTVYPQRCPPGVCNAQLDTSVKKSTLSDELITLSG
jgi:N-acetylmuramoyl-L-alanine amidase